MKHVEFDERRAKPLARSRANGWGTLRFAYGGVGLRTNAIRATGTNLLI